MKNKPKEFLQTMENTFSLCIVYFVEEDEVSSFLKKTETLNTWYVPSSTFVHSF